MRARGGGVGFGVVGKKGEEEEASIYIGGGGAVGEELVVRWTAQITLPWLPWPSFSSGARR